MSGKKDGADENMTKITGTVKTRENDNENNAMDVRPDYSIHAAIAED